MAGQTRHDLGSSAMWRSHGMPQVAGVPRSSGAPVDLAPTMALPPLSAGPVVAGVVAALFALGIGWLGFTGVDIPAQIYRLRLFQTAGWTTWDPGWYGGSQVLSYSVVF